MKRKDLSEKKWAVLEDLFYSELDENAVLKKHNVTRTTYERWLRQKLFSRQFQQYTASLARRTALAVAKAETEVAARLVELTRCQKEESARKACRQVLAIANRFFEAVARINEGPLKDNRGKIGGKSGKNGGNRGKRRKSYEQRTMNYHQKQAPSTGYHSPITNHQALAGENRGIFGLNQDTSGPNNGDPDHNHDNPDLSKMTYSQYSRILAILAEDVDENEPKVVQTSAPSECSVTNNRF
jgi:hypothetical protein